MTEAGAAAGVSRRTIARWKRDANFRRAVAQLRRDSLDAARARLEHHGRELVDRLLVVALEPAGQSHDTRLRAIVAGLRLLRDWHDDDLADRIERLEEHLGIG